jgi:hypothetical protein
VAWRAGVFSSDHWIVHGHSVSVKFSLADEPAWWFTGVYGPQDEGEKIEFLNELREVRGQCDGSWMLAGDFNMIYSAEDKNNDNLNRRSMGRFRRLVKDGTDKLSADSSARYPYPRPSSHIRTHIRYPPRVQSHIHIRYPRVTDTRGYIRLPVRINNNYNNLF